MRPTEQEVKALNLAGWKWFAGWKWEDNRSDIYAYVNDEENGWYDIYFEPGNLDGELECEIEELSDNDVVAQLISESSDKAILRTVHGWRALYKLQDALNHFDD